MLHHLGPPPRPSSIYYLAVTYCHHPPHNCEDGVGLLCGGKLSNRQKFRQLLDRKGWWTGSWWFQIHSRGLGNCLFHWEAVSCWYLVNWHKRGQCVFKSRCVASQEDRVGELAYPGHLDHVWVPQVVQRDLHDWAQSRMAVETRNPRVLNHRQVLGQQVGWRQNCHCRGAQATYVPQNTS